MRSYRIVNFGKKLNGRHGITGELIGASLEMVASHMQHANNHGQYIQVFDEASGARINESQVKKLVDNH